MRADLLVIAGTLLWCAVSHAAEPAEPGPAGVTAEDTALAVRAQRGQVGALTLHWLETGPADGLPVLLLHGARFHSGTWQELPSQLEQSSGAHASTDPHGHDHVAGTAAAPPRAGHDRPTTGLRRS